MDKGSELYNSRGFGSGWENRRFSSLANKFEICRTQVAHVMNGSGPCHHQPTPTINRLCGAARSPAVIDRSLQMSKSSAIHCEFRSSSTWEGAGTSKWPGEQVTVLKPPFF